MNGTLKDSSKSRRMSKVVNQRWRIHFEREANKLTKQLCTKFSLDIETAVKVGQFIVKNYSPKRKVIKKKI